MTELYRDKHEIEFGRVRADRLLPEDCRAWHPIHRVKLNSRKYVELISDLHMQPSWQHCWGCGRDPRRDPVVIQIHHIGSNGGTRSDEETCLIPLCWAFEGESCHPNIAGNLSKVLWARWRWGRESLDWIRLILCQGYWPDPPTAPRDGSDFWLPGFVDPATMKRAARGVVTAPAALTTTNRKGVRHG